MSRTKGASVWFEPGARLLMSLKTVCLLMAVWAKRIQFNATDYKCDITWLDGDPLDPQLNSVFVGQSNNPVVHEHGNVVKDFRYELTKSSQLNPVDGGGTIKVT